MCIAHWSPPHDIRRLRLERHGVELHLRIFIRSVFTSPGNRAVRTELQTTALWQKLLQRLLQTTLVETIVETIAIYTGRVCSALYASPHRGGGGWESEQNCRQTALQQKLLQTALFYSCSKFLDGESRKVAVFTTKLLPLNKVASISLKAHGCQFYCFHVSVAILKRIQLFLVKARTTQKRHQ